VIGMKLKQIRQKADYMRDIYNARVEVAIARWEFCKYLKKQTPLKETEKGEH